MKLDYAECFQKSSSIGYQTVYNICDGTQHTVPWGSADWFGACCLVGFLVAGILVISGMIYAATH